MLTIKKILMERDGISPDEATIIVNELVDLIRDVIDTGGSLLELDDILLNEVGLEPDYIPELLDLI